MSDVFDEIEIIFGIVLFYLLGISAFIVEPTSLIWSIWFKIDGAILLLIAFLATIIIIRGDKL